MKVVIIAPHQDDEILATGGLIQKCVALGDNVAVLFVTNGDYRGPHIAKQRYFESQNALLSLGLVENDIYYLGFADTGMRYSKSFLQKIVSAEIDAPLMSPFSLMTYHPAGKSTIHALRTGTESLLIKKELLADLSWFLNEHIPDLIIVPNIADMHGDHAAILALLENLDIFKQIPICLTYIVHGGNDMLWPLREEKTFTCPPILSSEIWKKRISIPLTKQEQSKKYQAIGLFKTQLKEDFTKFLISFSKQEEIFFLLRNSEINRQNICSHFECREIP